MRVRVVGSSFRSLSGSRWRALPLGRSDGDGVHSAFDVYEIVPALEWSPSDDGRFRGLVHDHLRGVDHCSISLSAGPHSFRVGERASALLRRNLPTTRGTLP